MSEIVRFYRKPSFFWRLVHRKESSAIRDVDGLLIGEFPVESRSGDSLECREKSSGPTLQAYRKIRENDIVSVIDRDGHGYSGCVRHVLATQSEILIKVTVSIKGELSAKDLTIRLILRH